MIGMPLLTFTFIETMTQAILIVIRGMHVKRKINSNVQVVHVFFAMLFVIFMRIAPMHQMKQDNFARLLVAPSYTICDQTINCYQTTRPFQCASGVCISGNHRCDNTPDCLDGTDEDSCGYYCESNDIGSISIEKLQTQFDLDDDKSQRAMDIANAFVNLGVNIQDSVLLVLLLFVNVIPSVFILIGLCLYDRIKGFQRVNISYIMFVIVVLQYMLVLSMHIFYQPLVQCYTWMQPTHSWFDILCGFIGATLLGIWCHHTYRGRCSRYYKVGVWLLVFAVPIIKQPAIYTVVCLDVCLDYNYERIQEEITAMNKFSGNMIFGAFSGLQLILPICWTIMANKQMIPHLWSVKIPKCEDVSAFIPNTQAMCVYGLYFGLQT
eukprot:401112_1